MLSKSLKMKLGAVALAASLMAPFANLAEAQVRDLGQVLREAQRDAQALSADEEARLREFQRDAGSMRSELDALRREVNGLQANNRALSTEYDANRDELDALDTELEEAVGDFSELLGQFKQAAGEIRPFLTTSIISTEHEGRAERLSQFAAANRLLTREEMDELWQAMLLETVAQSEVKVYQADVSNLASDDTLVSDADILRVGPFVAYAVNQKKFLKLSEEGNLIPFERQPNAASVGAMSKLANSSGNLVSAPVDPTRGGLFDMLKDLPGLMDRVEQGGLPGYTVLFLLAVGLLIGVWRLLTLWMTSGAVKRTMKTREGGSGNPLARIFAVYEEHSDADVEALELKLDEQILKETPRLERFINILKVLSAVAPLLGLLGTVVGMIRTFTQITLVGTGDPKTMAGGISQALVTTVEGLVAAIPLILIHAFCANSSKGVQQILEEQAAGLVAERAEEEGRGA